MAAPAYRDIDAERRARAAACVERHLAMLAGLMADAGCAYRTVEGSAVAAEVFLSETNTVHTAVRVAVRVAPRDRREVETTLRRTGFTACDPTGDGPLLRLASRGGRRAIHVLFGLDDEPGPRGGGRRHPGSEEAARERARRLRSAWVDLAATYRRVHHGSGDAHDVTESFEVQVIEATTPGLGG